MLVGLLGSLVVGCSSSPYHAVPDAGSNAQQPHETAAEKRRSAAQIHTELAQRYMQRGQLEEALTKLKEALKFDAKYTPAHTVIAVLYQKIGKYDLAEQQYRAAVKLEPDQGAVNNNLGQFLCAQGKVEESIGYFKKAVADPFYDTPAAAYTNAGSCLMKLHQAHAAELQLQNALSLQPKDPVTLLLMAKSMVAQQDYFHARAFIQRFDALGSPNPAALLLGYQIEKQLGDRKATQHYLKTLRNQFPDSEQSRSLNGLTTP
ncbi:MAG: type IV pilus biogenesis/stability protein PilW [Xanthomonadales bacterium]|nr:type IV pilus biogenesis/stability protein PilW [Xanthomonadales bacterium]